MATAKIATLVIRTLAKPIATQLKNQAAQHETFRNVCIGLAQGMHRTEMALRANLLPSGATQKVRPLNDAKAIANGANAISEGFLFAVAAVLILGETYRGSRKKAEQRDRTEEDMNNLRFKVEKLAEVLGIDLEQIGADGLASDTGGEAEEMDPTILEAKVKVLSARQEEQIKARQLQAAVEVLLTLAIKNQWVPSEKALELDGILHGVDTRSHDRTPSDSVENNEPSSRVSNGVPFTLAEPSSSASANSTIIQKVALARARAIAEEVRRDSPTLQIGEDAFSQKDLSASERAANLGGGGGEKSLAELLARIQHQEEQKTEGVNIYRQGMDLS